MQNLSGVPYEKDAQQQASEYKIAHSYGAAD